MSISINGTDHIVEPAKAKKWLRDHVIVKRADLKRIGKLCKKHGIYEELKAIGIDMHELTPGKGGSW